MKQQFLCWDLNNDPDGECPREIETSGPEWAAEVYAERNYYACDYPERQTICVKAPDGTVTTWSVAAEPDVRFVAMEVET